MPTRTDSGFILLVDDNPANLSVLSEVLRGAGFQFRVAMSGETALELVNRNPPELVLLDVMLPKLDGFAVCQHLKANPATVEIPIIFMTALTDTGDKVRGFNLGAVDYITKPFQKEEVLARVKLHLQLRQMSQTLEDQNQQLQLLTQELEQRVVERTNALQESEECLRQLTENINSVFWLTNLDKTEILYVSLAYEQIWGHSREELLNSPDLWLEAVHLEDRPRIVAALKQQVHGTYQQEYRIVRPDGTVRWIHDRAFPIRERTGQVYRIAGIAEDITNRKQAEAQLQQTNAELVRVTRLKDEFLATMSHELRTPLNAVLGMTEGLQDQVFGKLNSAQIKALQTIEQSGSHLLALISDILDVAKIESGQIELDLAPTAVTSLCHSCLAFIKQQALAKRIQLETKLPPNLPHLFVDERRIRQVLINLLSNAVKFTPEEGRITLEVSPLGQTRKHLRIAVADTGIGIAPEHFNQMFKPFIQIDSALNRQYEGTGLGLALVKRITELHGGEVKLSSEVGVGSCFEIDLPCIADNTVYWNALETDAPETQRDANPDSNHLKQTASPLILLTGDDAATISTVSSYLRARGYQLLLAKSGQEAIALSHTEHLDLILMDLQTSRTAGIEITQQISQTASKVDAPIIALARPEGHAVSPIEMRDRCLTAGATDYLSKPLKLKQLLTIVQKLLAS